MRLLAYRLMIPQLRELAGEYGVDGAWVDGDCWGTAIDHGEAAVRGFREQTGSEAVPRKPGDPFWAEWLAFHREGYRRYLRHYVDELRASHPGFQVISNWAFSDHMPEPVSAKVAALSGDFAPDTAAECPLTYRRKRLQLSRGVAHRRRSPSCRRGSAENRGVCRRPRRRDGGESCRVRH